MLPRTRVRFSNHSRYKRRHSYPLLRRSKFCFNLRIERFEKWLINTPNCCIDICDFDRFAKILRGNEIFKVEETQQKIQIPSDIDIDQPDLGTDIELDKTQSPIINTPPQQEVILEIHPVGCFAAIFIIAVFVITKTL